MIRLVPILILFFLGLSQCTDLPLNCPYTNEELNSNAYFTSFGGDPGTFDPQVVYAGIGMSFCAMVMEPMLGYIPLKYKRELECRTCKQIPEPIYYDVQGNVLDSSAETPQVALVEYRFELKEGILYGEHPCFAKDENDAYRYHKLTEDDIAGFRTVMDFKQQATRELTTDDFIYSIYRLADPRTNCPIISTLKQYIYDFEELNKRLTKKIDEIRKIRKEEIGPLYNQERDERERPLQIDRTQIPFKGVIKHDTYSFSIFLKEKYPPFLYWLTMLFFAPIPWEAEAFFNQAPMIKQNIVFSRSPVGTGQYILTKYDPNLEIIFERNIHYSHRVYPSTGEPGDLESGLLDDAGKPLPMIERQVFKLEKEPTTRWMKFLQGYYDASSVMVEELDRVLVMGQSNSEVASSEFLKERDILLTSHPSLSMHYFLFNIADPVWGGLEENQCKLRQAVSIVLDWEEWVLIFKNGIGEAVQQPLPPLMVGYVEGKEGMNPYTHNWDVQNNQPIRKSVNEAQELLAEAGYPGGYDAHGNQLVLHLDTAQGLLKISDLSWIRKKLNQLNIRLEVRNTNYDRLTDKWKSGSYQFSYYGWGADYPDAENFLFLFHCRNFMEDQDHPDYKCNTMHDMRYNNPKFNKLFKKVRSMHPSPERNELIKKCVKIIQHDAPWSMGYVPYGYSLSHGWVENIPSGLGRGGGTFAKMNIEKRINYIHKWNKPVFWPLILLAVLLVLFILPVIIAFRLREQGKI